MLKVGREGWGQGPARGFLQSFSIRLKSAESHVGVKGATCDLSELDLRSHSGVESSPARNKGTSPQDAQRQLRPRRVDGGTPRHLLCATVHSAGSQLPLEGTELYTVPWLKASPKSTCGVPHHGFLGSHRVLYSAL